MNQTIEWIQTNWYGLGSLIAQFTFLFASLWFARKILKTMRASQQQFGALLRLSMSEGLGELPKESEAIHNATPNVVAMVSPVIDRPTAPTESSSCYAAFEKPSRNDSPSLGDELHGRARAKPPLTPAMAPATEPTYEPTPYVAAPMTLPADEQSGSRIAAAVEWLQTPVASSPSDRSPWRKVVRWLQAPVRSSPRL